MSSVRTIQSAYAAFANNDPSVLFGAMAPDIQWHQAEGNPLADRNPYVGAQAVGDDVIVLGRYGGTIKHSGAKLDAPFLPCLPLHGRPHRVVPAVYGFGAVGA